ncbi:MAG: AAA family ATPase [Myxococcales bacterium]|nr:AAA family ATPase [Myxococcales bacterium]MCB9718509.1 AAA family ATPase [Myxococcales bacterium]
MLVERLQLTNFRGFEHLDLRFEPDLTVLVGVNGCGKTSVIDALLIGLNLQVWSPRDVKVGHTEAEIRTVTPDHPDAFSHAELVKNGTHVSTKSAGEIEPTYLPLVYGVWRGTWDDTPGSTRPGEPWGPDRAKMQNYGSVSYGEFFKWLREAEDEENEQIRYEGASEDPRLAAVRDAVRRLLPDYDHLRIRRRGAMGDERPRLTLEKDGSLLLFDSLSEGERTLIAMIADIARRLTIAHPDADDPLTQPFLLVIDEFEQHLHPQWQRELPRRLHEVFPRAQLIITTHSPIVVSEVLPRQIRALKDFSLLETAHREGQDVNEILEALFGTASRKPETQRVIDDAYDALDDDELDEASTKIATLDHQLGGDDPEVVRLKTLHRMLQGRNQDALPEE